MRQRHNHKKGFSLVEAAIVLAVVGLVVAGIWVAASSVRENMKIEETAGGVLTACSKLGQLFPRSMTQTEAEMGSWADSGLQTAAAAGVFPKSWIQFNGWMYTVDSPLGSIPEVFITASDVFWLGTAAGNIFIRITGLSPAQCQKLVANTASRVSNTSGSFLSGVNIKHYDASNNLTSDTGHSFPINLTPTDVDCSGSYTAVEFFCVRQ